MHAELMRDLRMTRAHYLRARRKQQPIAELERKAKKAKCRSNLWTQEELDFAAARALQFLLGLRTE